MSTESEPKRKHVDIDLPLPRAATETDDEYEGLSVIHVTPRLPAKMRTLTSLQLQSDDDDDDDDEQEPSVLASESSECSFTLSTAPSSVKFRREPNTVTLFLSSLTSGWSKSESGSERIRREVANPQSPSSVLLERKFSACRGSKSIELFHEEEKELLKRPIFCSIDGPDACEFQEFLNDHVGESHRIPVLCLVDYGGHGAHASDIWVLMHNTIRRELFDVFEIINSIRREYLSMTLNDVYNLRKWWRFFVILWSEFAIYEKTILDPIVQQICLVDGRSDVLLKGLGRLRDTREWLSLKMEEMTSYIEEFERLPPGRALCLFCKTVDSFGDRAMLYFAGVERLLPRYVESYHDEEIKLSVEGQLIERLRKGAYFAEFVVALVRWMGTVQGFSSVQAQSKEREKWLNTHLFWLERQNLPKYCRKYEASHGRVLTYFRERLKKASSL